MTTLLNGDDALLRAVHRVNWSPLRALASDGLRGSPPHFAAVAELRLVRTPSDFPASVGLAFACIPASKICRNPVLLPPLFSFCKNLHSLECNWAGGGCRCVNLNKQRLERSASC